MAARVAARMLEGEEVDNMDAYTLSALRGSIRKWEKIVAGTEGDAGWKNCPLCLRFGKDCCLDGELCPVFAATNIHFCDDTPYDDWLDHVADKHNFNLVPFMAECPACTALAQAEADFLKGLTPGAAE